MKKQQSKRVIPGFGLTMGVTLAMLSIVVLIPLASLAVYSSRLGFREFIQVITRPRVLSGFYVSFITAFAATVVNAIMGLILAWVLVRYDFPGKRIMDGMIELPFALPTAVAGISLTSLTSDKHEIPAVGGESAFDECACRFPDSCIADALREAVPAVPPHRRGQLDSFPGDQPDRAAGTPGGIFGLEFDRINSGASDPAGEYAGRGVEPGSRRRIRAVQTQSFPFDGEGQKEIAAGPYAENGRSMKAGRMKHSAHTVTLPSG